MTDSRITLEKLGEDNYGTWSIRMRRLLVLKGCGATIRSDYARPPAGEGAAAPPVDELDEKALSYIVAYVSDEHVATVDEAGSALKA